ncbi:MAG: hypothetical protein AB8B56_20375 [Crocinitomicaceae bacterium]
MKNQSHSRLFLVMLVLFLTSSESFGQDSDSLKYKLSFQIGGQRKRGVFSQTSLRVTSINTLEKGKISLKNFSSYTYTEVNGFNIADDWDSRTILLYKKDSSSRFLPALAHNFHSNVLYRIRNSNRGIAGMRITPFKTQDFTFLIGAGYEHSNYSDDVFLNSPYVSNQRNFALGFGNFSGKHKLGKHQILLDYNFSFVQSLREIKDYSIWLTSGISLPIGKVLYIGVNYDLRFRNVHLQDIPRINDLLMLSAKINISN